MADDLGNGANGNGDLDNTGMVRLGRALSIKFRTAHAITIGGVLAAVLGLLTWKPELVAHVGPESASASEVRDAWARGVDKRLDDLRDGKAERSTVDQKFSSLSQQVWWLTCSVIENERWEAIREGSSERAKYLTMKLTELSRHNNEECP